MIRRRILPLLILLIGVGGFLALKATRPKPPPVESRERVWRVETLPAVAGEHRPVLSLFGRVEAPDRLRAAAPVAGRVLEVLVRDGDRVSAGQRLARIDPRDLEPRLAQARAEVEKELLKAQHDREALEQEGELVRLAESAFSRADKVQSQKFGSESAVDEARQQLARARLAVTLREQSLAEHPARLASLQAKLAEAERDATRGDIVAPFDGRVGKVEAAAGDQLQPNQAILTLYPADGRYLRAKVPGNYSAELRAALERGERLVANGTYAGRAVSTELERLAGEADARGVDALLRLEPEADVPVGAFLELFLERPLATGTVALPFAALHGGDRVFVVSDARLKGVRVERVGEVPGPEGSQVLVRSADLVPGTLVMVTHLPHAVDGLRVEEVR